MLKREEEGRRCDEEDEMPNQDGMVAVAAADG